MNLVVISGRLTKDVELRYTQSGDAKVNFTVAVNREFTNRNGERESDFIQCEAWKGTAEFMANNLAKGNRVNIQGSWRTGSYEDSNGNKIYTNVTNVTSIKPIDWANSEQPQQQQQQTPGQQYQQRSQQNSQYQGRQQTQQRQPYNQNDPFAQQNNNVFTVDEEDLPF